MTDERIDGLADDAPPPPPGGEDAGDAGAADLSEIAADSPAETLVHDAAREDNAVSNEPKRRKGVGGKLAIAGVSTLALLGLAYVGAAWYVQDRVPNNTFVDGIAVGGLDAGTAVNTINEEFASRPVVPLTLIAVDRSVELVPSELGLSVDGAATIRPMVGFSLKPQDLWRHVTGMGNVDPVGSANRETAQSALVEVLPDLEVEPVGGEILLADGEAQVTDAVDEVRVDVPSSIDEIEEAWLFDDEPIVLPTIITEPEITAEDIRTALATIVDPLLSGPVTVSAGEAREELTPVDLTDAAEIVPQDGRLALIVDGAVLHEILLERNDGFVTEGTDARIVISNGAPTIIPSKNGESVDEQDLADAVTAAALSAEEREAAIEFVTEEPEFTTTDAEALGVIEKVSEFSTPLTADNVRTRNLINGSEKISNHLVMPGETFSLIDAIGPVTAERGFVRSGVVENGFATEAMGGGLSQLSTTTYNAAYFAGMEIVAHKPHSRWFSRYPEGRESTMWAPDVDMKFKNGTPYGVLVQAWTEGGRQWVRFWSTEYFTVETYTSGRYNITQPKIVYNSKPGCKPESGGQPGFSVDGARTRYLNGEQYDKWNWSWTYQPWNNVRCGTEGDDSDS